MWEKLLNWLPVSESPPHLPFPCRPPPESSVEKQQTNTQGGVGKDILLDILRLCYSERMPETLGLAQRLGFAVVLGIQRGRPSLPGVTPAHLSLSLCTCLSHHPHFSAQGSFHPGNLLFVPRLMHIP